MLPALDAGGEAPGARAVGVAWVFVSERGRSSGEYDVCPPLHGPSTAPALARP